jgi:hypothetical protein
MIAPTPATVQHTGGRLLVISMQPGMLPTVHDAANLRCL